MLQSNGLSVRYFLCPDHFFTRYIIRFFSILHLSDSCVFAKKIKELNNVFKKLHLGVSAVIIFGAAILYGVNPYKILPLIFGVSVDNLVLKNIFRAIMGLYIGFALYWVIGIKNAEYWRSATISNIIFMGGLAFGRLLSTILDGLSIQYTIGLILELIMMTWGIYNLKKENAYTQQDV